MKPSDLFAATCAALWGDRWVNQAAAAFGTHRCTVRRWRDGGGPPRWALAALLNVIEVRHEALSGLHAAIDDRLRLEGISFQ